MTRIVKRKGVVLLLIAFILLTSIPSNVIEINASELDSNVDADIDEDMGAIVDGKESEDIPEETQSDYFQLIAMESGDELLENPNIIGKYEDVYLLEYSNPEEAKEAYEELKEAVETLEPNLVFRIADEDYQENQEPLPEEEKNESEAEVAREEDGFEKNPINELEKNLDSIDNTESYDIAIIDTGSIHGDSISVIGEDGYDYNGHGTEMYNVVHSIAPEAKILSIKALNDSGEGDLSSVYAAMKYAIEMKVKVINLSISADKTEEAYLLQEIIEEAFDQGITVVGAAGNGGYHVESKIPGSIEKAVIIGSCNENGERSEYSNYGETVDYYIPGDTTSYSTARASSYIVLTGTTDGIEEYFIGEGVLNSTKDKDIKDEGAVETEAYTDDEVTDNALENQELQKEAEEKLEESKDSDELDTYQDDLAELVELPSDESAINEDENIINEKKYDPEISVVIKYLLVDEELVEDSDTFDSVLVDKMGEPVKLQFSESAKAYLQDSGEYVVPADTPFVNGIATGMPLDISFANGNDNGESIYEGVFFDEEKMRAVISKEALSRYDGDFSDIQVQIMAPAAIDESKIHVKVRDELGLAIAESGVYSANPWWNFELRLMEEEKAGLINPGNIVVKVNGDELRVFQYDKTTGILKLPVDAIRIKDVEILIKDASIVDVMKNTVFSTAYPAITNWLELDENVDVSKLSEGKSFTQKCLHMWSAEGYHSDFRGGADNYDKFASQSKTFDFGYAKSGDLPKGVSKGATNQELMTGAIAIPTNFYGIKNFVLHGKTNGKGESSTVTSGGKEYNYGLWGYCYHIDVANDQELKEKTVNFEVMDVSKKQDGYTYITMAYMLVGGRNSGTSVGKTDQTTGGYFGFRVKTTVVESDYSNLVIIKRAKNAKNKEKITEDYATFKVIWTGSGKFAGQSRTWYFKTIDGEANLNRSANLDGDYKSDELFIENNRVYYPPGKLSVTEERVPRGFNSADVTLTATISERVVNNKTIYDIDWDNATKNDLSVEYLGKERIEGSTSSKIALNLYNYEQMDSTNLVIQKLDGSTLKPIEDENPATFKVEYFRMNPTNWDGSDKSLTNAERTWWFKTLTGEKDELKGVVNFNRPANLDIDFDNDELFWYDKNHVGYPEGVLRVTEEIAPTGYSKSNLVMYAVINKSEKDGKIVYTTRWTEDTKKLNGIKYIGYTKPYESSQAYADQIGFNNYSKGKLKILKVSANPELTSGNNGYKLNGAEFGVYSTKENAENDKNRLDTLTTDASGNSNESKPLTLGTYWVKELKAPEGFKLNLDPVSITITAEGSNTVKVSDEPLYSVPKLLRKTSLGTGKIINTDSAVFKMVYSDNQGKDEKTWYFRTKNGTIDFSDESLLAEGYKSDKLLKVNGKAVYTAGKYTITEEKAPTGYIKNDTVLTGNITIKNNKADFKWETISNNVITFDEKDGSAYFGNQPKPVEIKTVASCVQTGCQTGTVEKTVEIRDKVIFKNLEVGSNYRFEGILKDASSGKEIAKTSMKYEAKKADGEVIMPEFKIDASEMAGRTLVVTELLWNEDSNKIVAKHEDLAEESQRIYFPRVRTMAIDSKTKTHTGYIGQDARIEDSVSMENLNIGDTYMILGTLMYSDGSEFLVNGEPLSVVTEEFVADKKDMKKTVVFNFDSSSLNGKSLVVFEKLLVKSTLSGSSSDEENGTAKSWMTKGWVQAACHEDINDKGQTIDYVTLQTNAVDELTESKTGALGEIATIIDKVTYSNLRVGEEYTVTGSLRYKEDCIDINGESHKAGDEVLDADGNPYISQTTFKADKKDGSVNLIYQVNSNSLAGISVVVFEDLYTRNVKVASHADLEDRNQTVDYPLVKTTAKSKSTGDHVGDTEEMTTIVDTVELKNLTPGEKYTVSGVLMDKESAAPVLNSEGNPIESISQEFEATERDMTITLEFNLSGADRQALTTVVFEDLIHKNVLVASHRDIEDEDQSIYTPKVLTSAKDSESEENVGRPREETSIVDTVSLENLIVGMEYTVKGTLIDKSTGEKYLDADNNEVHAEKTFVPESKNMEVELEFIFNGENIGGKSLVVFEDLIHNDIIIAYHRDVNDKDQTVDYPNGRTRARDAKTLNNTSNPSKETTIIDTVYYENLKEGLEYTLVGTLMDKGTGEKIMVDGNPVENTITFIPEEKNGEVEIPFTFDSSLLAGKSIVVFEKVKYNEVEVFVHENIESKEQTVEVIKPEAPNTPTIPKTPTTAPRTGDTRSLLISLILIQIAILGILFVIRCSVDEEENA